MGLEMPVFRYYYTVLERRKNRMNKYLDVEWIAVQAGVPVSFLLTIPVFFVIVLTLASKMGTKEPENYRVGRRLEAKSSNTWIAPVGLCVLVVVAISSYGRYFLPH
jgi:hypothetical protein